MRPRANWAGGNSELQWSLDVQCAGHSLGNNLVPTNYCLTGLWVSLGGHKAEGAHPDRKASYGGKLKGGFLTNWIMGSLLQLCV